MGCAPGARARHLAALRALDVLEHSTPRWWGAWMEATCPERGEPRYQLVVRRDGGDSRREVDSYAVYETIVGRA